MSGTRQLSSGFQLIIDKLGQAFDLTSGIDWLRLGVKSFLLLLFLSYSLKQSIDLLILYYSNGVKINLEIIRPDNLTLPAISLCFVYRHQFRQQHQPETIADYLNSTPSYSDLVQSCSVLDTTTFEHVDCSTLTRVQTVINRKYKCFSFFRSMSLTYPLKSIKSSEWLKIRLHKLALVTDVVGIAVHNNSDIVLPDLSDQSYYEIIRYWYNDGLVSRVTFTYSASASVLLPEPYTSKCIDYTKLEVETDSRIPLITESRKNLFASCIAQKYESNHSGYFPMTVFADSRYDSLRAKYKSDSNEMSREDYAVQENIKCRQEFPFPQCYSVNYAIKMKTTAFDNSPEDMELVLYPPTGNQINLIEVPRHEFREMIAMISGIFSFWIGISVVSIATPIAPLIASLCSRSCDPSAREQMWITKSQVTGTAAAPNRSLFRIITMPSSQEEMVFKQAVREKKQRLVPDSRRKSWRGRNQLQHERIANFEASHVSLRY